MKVGKYTPEEMVAIDPGLKYSENLAIRFNKQAATKTIYWYEIYPKLRRCFDVHVGYCARSRYLATSEAYDTWIEYLQRLTPNTK
jgi:hypothetical protein